VAPVITSFLQSYVYIYNINIYIYTCTCIYIYMYIYLVLSLYYNTSAAQHLRTYWGRITSVINPLISSVIVQLMGDHCRRLLDILFRYIKLDWCFPIELYRDIILCHMYIYMWYFPIDVIFWDALNNHSSMVKTDFSFIKLGVCSFVAEIRPLQQWSAMRLSVVSPIRLIYKRTAKNIGFMNDL